MNAAFHIPYVQPDSTHWIGFFRHNKKYAAAPTNLKDCIRTVLDREDDLALYQNISKSLNILENKKFRGVILDLMKLELAAKYRTTGPINSAVFNLFGFNSSKLCFVKHLDFATLDG